MTKMNTAYFQMQYYTVKDMAEILEATDANLRQVMKAVSFPEATLKVGITQLWDKAVAEAYFPLILHRLNTSSRDRRLAEIVADIRTFIDEKHLDHSDKKIFSVGRLYLSWTKMKVSERTIGRYGGWMVLVLKAIKEL